MSSRKLDLPLGVLCLRSLKPLKRCAIISPKNVLIGSGAYREGAVNYEQIHEELQKEMQVAPSPSTLSATIPPGRLKVTNNHSNTHNSFQNLSLARHGTAGHLILGDY